MTHFHFRKSPYTLKPISYTLHRAFTLIEMILAVSILMIILGIGIPIYQSLQNKDDLDIAATALAQTLRRAQALSQSGLNDASWGVAAGTSSITLFKGATYSSRDIDFDETFDTSSSIVRSGISEVIFTKFTGLPQVTGTITLTSSSNETRNITINEKGTINY